MRHVLQPLPPHFDIKGIAPLSVLFLQSSKDCLPLTAMVFVAMARLYIFPEIVLYLPQPTYGS